MATLLRARLRGRPVLAAAAVGRIIIAGVHRPDAPSRARLLRRIVESVLADVSDTAYTVLARDIGRSLADGDLVDARSVGLAIEALRTSDVVIATAAEHRLASAFLERIGLGDARLIASTLTLDGARARFEPHLTGRHKLEAVVAAGVRIGTATVYTDSASDLPLLLAARLPILVNPTRRSLRRVREVCPNAVVERW
jgi:phosphatidylglycerophosphatase C